jgi:glycosyltransferase involved in cell wall biosynthesis
MNKISTPLVSIIIPVFNGSNYLGEAIDSALSQTYSNIEVIVVNDGSEDNNLTKNLALSYGKKIRYIEKSNGGVSSALNEGIKHMNGKYFTWLSHDDVYLPEKIEQQISFVINNKLKVVYCNYIFINDLGHNINIKPLVKEFIEYDLAFQLLIGYPINGCTVMIEKSVFEKVGIFNIDLKHTQDYDFWVRILKFYHFNFLDIVVMKSRIHPLQDSNRNLERHHECDELYVKIARFFIEQKPVNNLLLFKGFKSLIRRGYYASSVMCFSGISSFSFKVVSILWFQFFLIFATVRKVKNILKPSK